MADNAYFCIAAWPGEHKAYHAYVGIVIYRRSAFIYVSLSNVYGLWPIEEAGVYDRLTMTEHL